MVDDIDDNNGIASDVVRVTSRLAVCSTVERNGLITADGEGGINVYQFANSEVQTVVIDDTADLLCTGEFTGLTGSDTMPYKRYLIRAYNSYCINRIYVVNS